MSEHFIYDNRERKINNPLSESTHDSSNSTSETYAPLSFAQSRFWYHEQLHPDSPLFNVPLVIDFTGYLNVTALEEAFFQIVTRHEILRTVFRIVDDEPMQIVKPPYRLDIPIEDLTGLPEDVCDQATQAATERIVRASLDLSKGPIFFVRLIKIRDFRWRLVMMSHHIAFDDVSRMLILEELADFYASELGDACPPEPLPMQYRDFSFWQRSKETEEALNQQLHWWTKKLDGAPALLTLPTDRPRPPVQYFRGNTCDFSIESDLVIKLGEVARNLSVTKFTVIVTVLNIMLHRLTGQSDIVICSGISSRRHKDVEKLIGCFVNVLLLRTQFSDVSTCAELVANMRQTLLDGLAHQDVSFEKLVAALAPERDLSYNALAQVMIVYYNKKFDEPDFSGLKVEKVIPERLIAQYDLLLRLYPEDTKMQGKLEYNTDLFDQETVERFCQQFVHVLREVLANIEGRIDEISLLPPTQVKEILGFNGAQVAFPNDRCIHELIEARVWENPAAPAVETVDTTLSYGEVNAHANRLANRLKALGIGRGNLVGVSLERSPLMVIALLGIVKCGAAYVPIDPNYPTERIGFIISDSHIRLLITESNLADKFDIQDHDVEILYLDQESGTLGSYSAENSECEASPGDLLYLIYTSGSTGAPKGVMLDHRGRVNNFYDFNNRFGIGPGDRLIAVSSLSFDMCAYDVFGMLMSGGTVVLPSESAIADPLKWAELIETKKITIWHSAPALLGRLLDQFDNGLIERADSIRLVLLGGDWIPLTMPDRLHRYAGPETQVVSLGGATEASMDSTIFLVEECDSNWVSIPYGIAMANQSTFVLDEQLHLAPIGRAGDLYLGGIGVGQGYFQRPGLTASRFLPNPYGCTPGERMYLTGDVARWTNADVLELLGRSDFQVKVNGVRIELGEIDAALSTVAGVKECVTSLHRPDDGSPTQLVSYVVPDENTFDWELARGELLTRLPTYMVPRYHVRLDRLPLSPNGKVLRTGLPPLEITSSTEADLVEPQTIMERTLMTLWSIALGTDDFGIDHDFFDLGGTSLQAALIVNKMPRKFSLVEFMRNTTIRRQAQLLSDDDRSTHLRIFRFPAKGTPRVTLLCAPYAGGSPIIFRQLMLALPDDVVVAVACMPSPSDCKDPALTLERIADECLAELSAQELNSIAIYGHCAGTALATELAVQLEAKGHSVLRLFLAAAMPRGVPSPFTMPKQSEQEIIDFLAALGGTEESSNAEDWKVMVREFQRDSRLVSEYFTRKSKQSPNRMATSIEVLMADDDPITQGYAAHAHIWNSMSDHVNIHKVKGGHYFISTDTPSVAKIINSSI